MSDLDDYRRAIGAVVDVPPDHVTLFWRGRVALYAILRALGVGPGDEVVVPAFTCVAVPNAILYTGAAPVYVDVDEATYTPDRAAVEAAMGPRTRVVLAQNTFGLSADIEALQEVAAAHGAVVVDDCTHGFGGEHRGRPNGSAAHAAFYSTQWSKPFSTGLGGIAVTADAGLARELRALERTARDPTTRDRALLRAMVFARERVATERTIATGRALYRTLSHAGVVPGSSSRDELERAELPPAFLTRLSPLQGRLGLRGLNGLAGAMAQRRATARRYSRWLTARGRTAAHEPPDSTHAFLRYPLRVRGREGFLRDARRQGLDLGDWFSSPLYPIAVGELGRWGYRWGTAPVAERVSAEIVNLPTEVSSDRQVDAIERFLEASVERIL
jgi:dTDP-4-amino-4,6-dideoxygalactose transaminase